VFGLQMLSKLPKDSHVRLGSLMKVVYQMWAEPVHVCLQRRSVDGRSPRLLDEELGVADWAVLDRVSADIFVEVEFASNV
jgi:hypothetical protein